MHVRGRAEVCALGDVFVTSGAMAGRGRIDLVRGRVAGAAGVCCEACMEACVWIMRYVCTSVERARVPRNISW